MELEKVLNAKKEIYITPSLKLPIDVLGPNQWLNPPGIMNVDYRNEERRFSVIN